MASSQQFSLKWTNYTNHITNAFDSLRSKEDFCDVTLSCEGRKIRAHKVLLSACSSYFKDIFKENPCQHPVIVFRNVKYDDLFSIVVYMYQGEVNIEQESLPTFLHTAEMLSIQGLTDDDEKHHKNDVNAPPTLTSSVAAAAAAAVAAPVTVQQPTNIPVAIHGQARTRDARLRSTHTKLTVAKHQPISLLSAATPGDQIMYTTVAAPPVSIVQDLVPVKRKKPNKPDVYAVSPAAEKTTSKSPVATTIEEHPDPEDHVAVEFFKTDADDLSDYGDDKTYQADDEPEPELYESASQEDDEKDAAEFDKPNLATQAELGRLFSSGGTPDVPAKRPSTGVQNTPDTSASSKWSQCQFCKLVITTVNLWRHIRTQHTDQPPLQCEYCQKSFKNKYSKREHIHERNPLAETSKNTELTCGTCNRLFASLSARRRHEKSKHSEISEQFECRVCGNRFKTKWSLSTHFSRFHRSDEGELITA